MSAIKINVHKQLDGYSFSLSPTVRERVKNIFPNAHPANNIFVGYDVKSDFEHYFAQLENYIFPALLGVTESNNLEMLGDIEFVDMLTGQVLHQVVLRDEKV